MDNQFHDFTELFQQLGLPAGRLEIEMFIMLHSPLPDDVVLADADIWNSAQAVFLHETFEQDSDWIITVDRLNQRLHCRQQENNGS